MLPNVDGVVVLVVLVLFWTAFVFGVNAKRPPAFGLTLEELEGAGGLAKKELKAMEDIRSGRLASWDLGGNK